MKKTIFIALLPLAVALHAQKCLNISVSGLMNKIETPGNAAASFKKCNVRLNDHQQTEITDYGQDLEDIDTMIAQTSAAFNMASISNTHAPGMQAPSQQDVASMQQLSDQLKSMTPEQQKEWAMQMAQERMKNPGAGQIQDSGPTAQLVFQTRDIGSMQMKAVNDEFSAKINAVDDAASKEVQSVKMGDKSKCPQDITGLPACDCANEVDARYWKEVADVRDKYNKQKSALLQEYTAKIKALAQQVDNNIDKLQKGDALKSSQLKQILFSAQSSAFANAFMVTSGCLKNIRKDGADIFVNKLNCDNKVFDMGCYHK